LIPEIDSPKAEHCDEFSEKEIGLFVTPKDDIERRKYRAIEHRDLHIGAESVFQYETL
jgi:hypothetical protein